MNGIWMTAYVTPAFAGQALPIPPAARAGPLAQQGEAADCLEAGDGGEAPRSGKGVITGGGGHHAPAFSRPKAHSKGRTPGGGRIVRGDGLRARNHSKVRRGANVKQARGTETVEPRRLAEADQEVEAVSAGAAGTAIAAAGGGGGGDDGQGPSERGVPLPAAGSRRAAATRTGEEVSGVVIGSPDGSHGRLAFGAPGLHGAGAGSGEGPGTAIAIGAAALLAALVGIGRERRRGAIA
jgi:hypothetical protein